MAVYTPIPDKEAATLLRVSHSTIRNAVKRGDLTRIPSVGQLQHVPREQVVLFKGMKQIIRDGLSEDRRKEWEDIKQAITEPALPPVQSAPAPAPAPTTPPAPITVQMNADELIKALINNGLVTPAPVKPIPMRKVETDPEKWPPQFIVDRLLQTHRTLTNNQAEQESIDEFMTVTLLFFGGGEEALLALKEDYPELAGYVDKALSEPSPEELIMRCVKRGHDARREREENMSTPSKKRA